MAGQKNGDDLKEIWMENTAIDHHKQGAIKTVEAILRKHIEVRINYGTARGFHKAASEIVDVFKKAIVESYYGNKTAPKTREKEKEAG